jgi:hypothetical protein
MTIDYDASRTALYSPGKRATIFQTGKTYEPMQLAVEAARLAYVRAEVSATQRARLAAALARVGFSAPEVFTHAPTGTQGFGAYRAGDGTALVAFRGTQPDQLLDLATDLEAYTSPWSESAGRVHAGFAKAARGVMPPLGHWLDHEAVGRSTLIVTGHSLGAAVATLAASAFRPTMLVTLGSPRVGDAAFAATVAGIDGARLVDCCDIVTELPPEMAAYTHVRAPVYIARDGTTSIDPVSAFIENDRRYARTEYVSNHAWSIGTVAVRDLADHAPINYARAFF